MRWYSSMASASWPSPATLSAAASRRAGRFPGEDDAAQALVGLAERAGRPRQEGQEGKSTTAGRGGHEAPHAANRQPVHYKAPSVGPRALLEQPANDEDEDAGRGHA